MSIKKTIKKCKSLLGRLKKPKHSVQLALLAVLVSVLTFTFASSLQQQGQAEADQAYLRQLSKEISLNLNSVKFYEEQVEAKHLPIPVIPVTIVYESGLQNGLVGRLPQSTQNSLFTAYSSSENILMLRDKFDIANYGASEYQINEAFTGAFIDAFKINLIDAQERGLYLTDPYREARDLAFVVSAVLFFAIILQLGSWASLTLITTHRRH